jgi:Uma2 family endonuclease
VFALERNVPLYGYGSATFRREAEARGAEPDECYVRGGPLADMPDVAIEVVLTSGGIDKLAVYEKLGVAEVWFFEDGEFHLHRLGAAGYEAIASSIVVPELDIALLSTYARRADQHEAVLEFRDQLRAGT